MKFKEALAYIVEFANKPAAERDSAKFAEAMKVVAEEMKRLNADGPGEFEAFKASIKGQMDLLADEIKRFQKLGLSVHGGGAVLPRGRLERIQMLADGRAFMSDATAERFGAYAALKLGGERASTRAREIGTEICKAAGLDPTVGTQGEYLIPDEFRPELVRNVEAVGMVFTQMRRVPLLTIGQTTWPKRTGGLTAYPTAAAAKIRESAMTVDRVVMQPVKWATLTAVPNEFFAGNLLVDLGQWIATEIAYAMAYAFDNAVLNGDGSADYGAITGILQDASIGAITATDDHDEGAEITGQDVSDVIGGLTRAYALGNARWILSVSMKGHCRALKSTTGAPLYQRGGNGEPNTIDDYPYVVSQFMPARSAIATSALWSIFGDLRMSHQFGSIGEVKIATSTEAGFTTDTTYVRGLAYVDCKVLDELAVVCGKTHS